MRAKEITSHPLVDPSSGWVVQFDLNDSDYLLCRNMLPEHGQSLVVNGVVLRVIYVHFTYLNAAPCHPLTIKRHARLVRAVANHTEGHLLGAAPEYRRLSMQEQLDRQDIR